MEWRKREKLLWWDHYQLDCTPLLIPPEGEGKSRLQNGVRYLAQEDRNGPKFQSWVRYSQVHNFLEHFNSTQISSLHLWSISAVKEVVLHVKPMYVIKVLWQWLCWDQILKIRFVCLVLKNCPFPCFLTEKLYAYYVPLLRWVHTCNITAYCNAITLQVTDTIQSCELTFILCLTALTVSCEHYTMGFPVCYGSLSDVFATSSGFIHLSVYIYYALNRKRKERTVMANAAEHKQGSVQRFEFAGRL